MYSELQGLLLEMAATTGAPYPIFHRHRRAKHQTGSHAWFFYQPEPGEGKGEPQRAKSGRLSRSWEGQRREAEEGPSSSSGLPGAGGEAGAPLGGSARP